MDVAGWGATDLEPAQSAASIPFILPSLLLACSPLDGGAEQEDGYLQMSKQEKKKKSVSSPKSVKGAVDVRSLPKVSAQREASSIITTSSFLLSSSHCRDS